MSTMSFLGIANTLLLGTGRILNKYHSKTLHSIYDFKSKSMMLSANPSVGDLVEGEIYKSDDRIDSPLIFLKIKFDNDVYNGKLSKELLSPTDRMTFQTGSLLQVRIDEIDKDSNELVVSLPNKAFHDYNDQTYISGMNAIYNALFKSYNEFLGKCGNVSKRKFTESEKVQALAKAWFDKLKSCAGGSTVELDRLVKDFELSRPYLPLHPLVGEVDDISGTLDNPFIYLKIKIDDTVYNGKLPKKWLLHVERKNLQTAGSMLQVQIAEIGSNTNELVLTLPKTAGHVYNEEAYSNDMNSIYKGLLKSSLYDGFMTIKEFKDMSFTQDWAKRKFHTFKWFAGDSKVEFDRLLKEYKNSTEQTDRRVLEEPFHQLKDKDGLVTLEAFEKWEEVAELIEEGVITNEDISKILTNLKVSSSQMNFKEFVEISKELQDAAADGEDGDGDDDEDYGEGGDDDYEAKMLKSYIRLKGKSDMLHLFYFGSFPKLRKLIGKDLITYERINEVFAALKAKEKTMHFKEFVEVFGYLQYRAATFRKYRAYSSVNTNTLPSQRKGVVKDIQMYVSAFPKVPSCHHHC